MLHYLQTMLQHPIVLPEPCPLYTSDAADYPSNAAVGGPRQLYKKNREL